MKNSQRTRRLISDPCETLSVLCGKNLNHEEHKKLEARHEYFVEMFRGGLFQTTKL
jgi:hypothetical protein